MSLNSYSDTSSDKKNTIASCRYTFFIVLYCNTPMHTQSNHLLSIKMFISSNICDYISNIRLQSHYLDIVKHKSYFVQGLNVHIHLSPCSPT